MPAVAGMVSKITAARERFIYFPSVFSMILLVLLLHYLAGRLKYFLPAAILLSLACIPSLYTCMRDWRAQAQGSRRCLETIKAELKAHPDWREPEVLQRILFETYKDITGRRKLNIKVFKAVRNEYDLYDIFPPVWLDQELVLPLDKKKKRDP